MPHCCFQALAFGNIPNRHQHKLSVIGLDRIEPDFDRHFRPVLAHPEKLVPATHAPGNRRGEEALTRGLVTRTQVRRHQHLDRLANEFVARVSVQFFGFAVGECDAAVLIDHEHRDRCGFDRQFKTPLQASAFAYIHYHGEDVHCPAGIERLQRNLDRDASSVLVQRVQLTPGCHGTRSGSGEKRMPQFSVAATQRRRYQRLDLIAEQFVTRISDERLRLLVHEHDAAAAIDNEHRNRRRLDDRRQQGQRFVFDERQSDAGDLAWLCVGHQAELVDGWARVPAGLDLRQRIGGNPSSAAIVAQRFEAYSSGSLRTSSG